MAAARACEEGGLSPGAGLADADAQAEAAFADMINTTVDVTGEQLDEEALDALARGVDGCREHLQEERRICGRRQGPLRRPQQGRAHRPPKGGRV